MRDVIITLLAFPSQNPIRFYNEDDLKAHLLDVVELIKKNKTTIQTYTKMHHHNKLKLFKNLFDTRRLGNNYNEQNLEALQKPRNDYTKTSLEALKESLRKGAMQCNEVSSWTEKYVRVAAKQELLRAVIQDRKNTRTETKKNQSSDNNEQNIANNTQIDNGPFDLLNEVSKLDRGSISGLIDLSGEDSSIDWSNDNLTAAMPEEDLKKLRDQLEARKYVASDSGTDSADQNLCIPEKRPNNELSASNNDEINNEVSQAKRMKQ